MLSLCPGITFHFEEFCGCMFGVKSITQLFTNTQHIQCICNTPSFSFCICLPLPHHWVVLLKCWQINFCLPEMCCVFLYQHFQTMLKTKLNVLTLRKEQLPTVIFHEPEAIELCSTTPLIKSKSHAGYKVRRIIAKSTSVVWYIS